MPVLNPSETRILEKTLKKVLHDHERVRIDLEGGEHVWLVSEEAIRLLDEAEDRYWGEEGQKALERFEKSGKPAIPWEKTKAELGL